jgi:hypothetical protein
MWSVVLYILVFGQGQPPASGLAAGLKGLEGQWEVHDAQACYGVKFALPAETGLTQKGARVAIRGNQLLSDGKFVATLTLDFSASDLKLDEQVKYGRRPIMLTLPDGKGILCAFKMDGSGIEMVHPHTMGRVGVGNFLYLKRPAKK